MSEYSESFHLRSEDQTEGVDLLKRAGAKGAVFAPVDGWVTIVPEVNHPDLTKSNQGVLLYYNYAEDHGWNFDLYEGPEKISEYNCQWESPEDVIENDEGFRLHGDFAIGDENVNLQELIRALGRPIDQAELKSILNPSSIDEHLADSVAYRFARLIGLQHYQWLAFDYLDDRHRKDPSVIFLN